MQIIFADSEYTIDEDFKRKYIAEVKAAYKEVTMLLPFGSKHINFFVQPREYSLIPETQDSGRAHNGEFLELAFNPTVDAKGLKVILNGVKATVFHEMNHAARFNLGIFHNTFLNSSILEGLATVFEREYGKTNPPYGKYPDNVAEWIQEIIDKNDMFAWVNYSFDHPDGRRWISYKVGTYIVDEAIKNSGKTVIELTQMECSDILKLAKVNTEGYTGLSA
jgi:Predicted Zn-dependent protease (DUF2268)